MKFKIAILVISALSLTACAHAPTKADEMNSASAQAKNLGNQWEQGSELVSSGTAKQKKGRSLTSEGEAQVSKGEKLIAKGDVETNEGKQQVIQGTRIQQKSENNFNQQFPQAN